jgi:putative intracellular protease/amidase
MIFDARRQAERDQPCTGGLGGRAVCEDGKADVDARRLSDDDCDAMIAAGGTTVGRCRAPWPALSSFLQGRFHAAAGWLAAMRAKYSAGGSMITRREPTCTDFGCNSFGSV